ncbi:PAS domain-containing sensor histidine kinase [Thiohalomonas denitrificans]|uniref:PAS domain-containing sensor histidine kinase n=1 Tax=Thiohalomonas denitrificans TaxID=415747 RepID=UPI0026EDDD5B|nr:PAS domain-containing sensor histidine kinase [Thiohalomonas denitrificans]
MKDSTGDRIPALEREVQALREALDASREREQRYRSVFDSMIEGFGLAEILLDDQGCPCDYRFLEVNEAFGQLVGVPPEVAKGKTVRELIPSIEAYWIETYGKVVRTGEPVRFENYAVGLDKWFEVTAYRTGPGRFAHLFADVTKRKQAEQASRENEQRLWLVIDSLPVLISYLDAGERYQFNNAAYGKWFGLAPEEVKGRTLKEVVGERAYQTLKPYVQKVLAGDTVRFDMVVPYRLGGTHEIEAVYVPHIGTSGEVLGFYALVQDVSELSKHKKEEAALRVSEERLALAQKVAGIGSFDWEVPEGKVVWTEGLERLYGLEPGEYRGTYEDWFSRIHPDDQAAAEDSVRRAIEQRQEWRTEFRILRKDGAVRWVYALGSPIFDESRQLVRFLGINLDISERKQAEEALRRANAELQQFAHVTSHDLRAPLRAVSNLSKSLEEDLGPRLSDENRYHLHLIRKRSQAMEAFIRALLAYAEAGGQTVQVETVDSKRLIASVLGTYEMPREFQVHIDQGMPRLITDPVKLQQVFANLIGNAIKYHDRPDGSVHVSVRELDEQYEFSVADDGPGIPAEYQERIFGMFERAPGRSEHEGSGIGLAVVKKLVESVGGDIELQSEPGRGSTVRFKWPKVIEL